MISPAENVTGAKVIVNIKPPFKAALGVPVYANADGNFEYDLQCDDINHAGSWSVFTNWEGTSCRDNATSESVALTVIEANCSIVLDSTNNAIKLGNGVSITGKVKTEYYCENLMTHIPVSLRITGPNEFSYKGPLDQDNIREGEYFLADFFQKCRHGKKRERVFC
jgi:hypothetical protein